MNSSVGGGARKAWIVAASIGAVEALKDQLGFCRWNYALRSLHQHAKANLIIVISPPRLSSSPSASASTNNMGRKDQRRLKKTEESLNKVIHLSCWGPNSVRF